MNEDKRIHKLVGVPRDGVLLMACGELTGKRRFVSVWDNQDVITCNDCLEVEATTKYLLDKGELIS